MKPSRLRAPLQVVLHAAILAHLYAWYGRGWRGLGGTDIQSFFHDFLGSGLVSAGVIVAGAAYLSTIVLGRAFCGWACHFGGIQDLAAWILRKCGWRPFAIQTRFLHHLPVALLLVAFILPSVIDHLGLGGALPLVETPVETPSGEPAAPRFELRLDLGGAPWANLPGAFVSAVTFLACGGGILLFLGTRGFCRYVCPYGALFRGFDRLSPFRIRRRSPCGGSSCGPGCATASAEMSVEKVAERPLAPCTAACPMGVSVHEEAQSLGAVRDADCIRCNLCVEACPSGALVNSFVPIEIPILAGAAPLSTNIAAGMPPPRYSLELGEELLVLAAAVVAFAAWDLVHAAHFLAAAMALGEGFLALLAARVLRKKDLRLARIALRCEGSWTFAGIAVEAIFLLSLVAVLHAGTFKALRFAGDRAYLRAATLSRSAETAGSAAVESRRSAREALERAAASYDLALRCIGRDRTTRYRRCDALLRLGDPRAEPLAEEIARDFPGDQEAAEFLRRFQTRVKVLKPVP